MEDRYYMMYDNHREYSKYDHSIGPKEKFSIIFGVLVTICICVCCFCRKVDDTGDEESSEDEVVFEKRDQTRNE
jgi:hypothetical protein